MNKAKLIKFFDSKFSETELQKLKSPGIYQAIVGRVFFINDFTRFQTFDQVIEDQIESDEDFWEKVKEEDLGGEEVLWNDERMFFFWDGE